ncbi:MAG: DUF1844 domain-containing protein [Verrucomicrobiota bacterium]|nr:DUF1844 domain-containing protein [Verrucomicrobiota bacterium]
MAEVQTNTNTGEMAQRFIEFIMMQAQNAALFLGQIPNPQTGQGEVNLELAKMFIDQLAMIQEKTRGNLSNEEAAVLKNTIANLQMAFVEVSQQAGGAQSAPAPQPPPAAPEAKPSSPTSPAAEPPPLSVQSESESRKKFTKSYGA